MIQVRCEGCAATFDMDERRIPKTGMRARCPRCGTSLMVSPTGEATVSAKPGVAQRVGTQLMGGADLPAVASPNVTDLPSVAKPGGADLPAVAKPGAVDLPAVAKPGAVDLPAVAKPGAVDLPAVARPNVVDLPSVAKPGVVDLPVPSAPKAPPRPPVAPPPAPPKAAAPPPPPPKPAAPPPNPSGMDFDFDLPVAAPPQAPGLPAVKAPAAAPAPAPAADMFELDDFGGGPAPTPSPVSSELDDPFAVDGFDLPAPTDLPTVAQGPGLPVAKGPDLPAPKALGRVQLEKRAVPVTDLPAKAGAPLPTPAQGIGLPAPQAVGLPAAAGVGLPTPSGSGLPMVAGVGLPNVAGVGLPAVGGAGLPTAATAPLPSVATAPLPSPASDFGTLDFGEEPIPTAGDEPLDFSPPTGGHAEPAHAPGAHGGAHGGAQDEQPRGVAGGVGFGEIDLGGGGGGGGGEDAGAEFDALPMGEEKPSRPRPAAAGGVELDAPLPHEQQAPGKSGPTVGREPKDRAKDKSDAPPRNRGFYAGLVAVGVLIVGGAALSMTPHGPFGINFIDDKINGPGRHAQALQSIRTAQQHFDADTFGRARRALRELDAQLQRTPAEVDLLAFNVYAHYLTLARFGNDSALAARARTLFERLAQMQQVSSPFLPHARAARDYATGHPERVPNNARDPLLQDLALMAKLEGTEAAEAVETARNAAQRRPSSRTRYQYARALFLSDDRDGASREAEAIVTASQEHAGARLLLARLLSERSDGRERALALAQAVEAMSAAASTDERAEAAVLVGNIELAREHNAPARAAFDRAIALDPRSGPALVGSGMLLYRGANYTEAQARFQAAHSADADSIEAAVGLAMTYIAQNSPGEARTLLEPMLQNHGGEAQIHYWLGRALLGTNDQTAAERELREAIRLDNRMLEPYTTLASLLFTLQRPEAAEQVLQQARQHVSDQAAIHRALGEGRAQRGDLEGARSELVLAVQARPSDARAHFLLAQVLRRTRDFDGAQREIEAAARADADLPGLLLERGLIAEWRGDPGSALTTFRGALARDPQNEELIVRVGAALVATRQYAEAEAQLARFVIEHPNNAEAQYVLGRARFGQGNLQDAIRLLERATELDATRADFRAWAAQANLERGQVTRALEHANQAIVLDSSYGRGYWIRAEVRVRQGAVREALVDANAALRLDPTFPDAFVTLADADEALGHAREAIVLYQRALTAEPNRGDWHARMGRLLADQGRTGEAIAALQRATGIGDPMNPAPPWLPPAHRQLGDLLRERDPRAARSHYERFVRMMPSNAPGVIDVRNAIEELR